MKVKDIINKIRLVDTEIILKEYFKIVCVAKIPIKGCGYDERAVLTFQPIGKNKLEIFIKPID